jgi:RNase P subunit RPR2
MNYDQREDAYAAERSQIKIIKRGKKAEDKIYQGTCRNCETVIEFPRGAAKFTDDQRDGAYLSVTCPVCSRSITVEV